MPMTRALGVSASTRSLTTPGAPSRPRARRARPSRSSGRTFSGVWQPKFFASLGSCGTKVQLFSNDASHRGTLWSLRVRPSRFNVRGHGVPITTREDPRSRDLRSPAGLRRRVVQVPVAARGTRARPNDMRLALGALAGAVMLALLAVPATVAASTSEWQQLEARIAQPWPALQERGGHFRDYILSRAPGPLRDDYGDAMLGYAVLRVGVRTGDRGLIDAGLRGVTEAAGRSVRAGTAMFRNAALAGAYNFARTRLAGSPAFARDRPRWERTLRGVRVVRIGAGRPVTNKSLVEAVAAIEIARSGIARGAAGTISNDPGAAIRSVKVLLGKTLPAAASKSSRNGRTIVGDFPDLPLAYHALALGFFARALVLLGREAPAAARALLGRAANASLAFAAPDGDVSYIGRSQGQSWTLALTAFAEETARRLAPGGERSAADYRALAERAIARLAQRYVISDQGLLVTPALGRNLDRGLRGLDEYVAAASYNGLTMVGLDWALDAASDRPVATGTLRADRPGSTVLGSGSATFAAVRRGDAWFAVRQGPSAERGGDLRYDFGLVALKLRRSDGGWDDVVLARPATTGRRDSAGPSLALATPGGPGYPVGRSLRTSGAGTVTVPAVFRSERGRTLRSGVTFRFIPTACGVSIAFPAERADRFEYSTFFAADGAPPTASPGRILGDTEQVTYSGKGTVSFQGGYASGIEPRLVRARLNWAPPSRGGTITLCRR